MRSFAAPTFLLLALVVSAHAGDLPRTGRCVFDGVKPGPGREIELPPGLRAVAVLPDGVESPAVCILGPIRRLDPGANGKTALPPAWTFLVGPADPSLTEADFEAIAADVRDRRIPGLDLTGCRGVTDAALVHLVGADDLLYLSLANTAVTDAGLDRVAKLPGLLALDLSMTRVTDRGLGELAPLRDLAWLSLAELPITDDGLKTVLRLPALSTLRLDGTRVTPAGLAPLRGRTGLRELSLSRATVTDDALKTIGTLTGLTTLHLRFPAGLTDEGIGRLAALTGLKSLSLPGATGITDAALATLAGLAGLEWLDLSRCTGLTAVAVEKLRTALPACRTTGPNDLGLLPSTPAAVRPR